MLLVYNGFEWDLREAAANVATHGVTFREASTVFADEKVAVSQDARSGHLRAVGRSSNNRVLAVVHQPGRRIRIFRAAVDGVDVEAAMSEGAAVSGEVASAPVTATPAAPQGVFAAPEPRAATAETDDSATRPVTSMRPARARSVRPSGTVSAAPVPVAVEPVAAATRPARKPTSDTPPVSGTRSAEGWTAETYGVYWDAYSAARDEARREGKSLREAQRLGKEAGERAINAAPEAPSQRARARAMKVG